MHHRGMGIAGANIDTDMDADMDIDGPASPRQRPPQKSRHGMPPSTQQLIRATVTHPRDRRFFGNSRAKSRNPRPPHTDENDGDDAEGL